MNSVIGLDIGGANLKAACLDGAARSRPFQLWKHPQRLAEALRELLAGWDVEKLAITMTGELCDCFATKREGVRHILAEVERAFPAASYQAWSTGGCFLNADAARQDTLAVSAANWHALATFAGKRLASTGPALLIDAGSTTTDVIPILDGVPASLGRTDSERLESRELVYTGVRRTPICALLHEGLAAELFATTLDAYLLLGHLAENPDDCDTADGRPATRELAHARLARMLGGDPELTPSNHTHLLATTACAAQVEMLTRSIERVVASLAHQPVQAVSFAGSGEFLARTAWNHYQIAYGDDEASSTRLISLADALGPAVSTAACAYAVAVLAEDR